MDKRRGREFRLNKKKIFFIILLALFLAYSFWLSFNILSFKTYKAPEQKAYPLEIQGVYHIHTTLSDGRKNPDEIAKLASQASLDFIILIDHGSPNQKLYSSQGWKNGVLVLTGSELSVSRGHLVALGYRLPSKNFSQNAEEAVWGIIGAGGFSVIAHPHSKVQWSWGEFIEYSGIEIINADSMFKEDIISSLPYFPALLLKPEYALLKTFEYPYREMKKWDELNSIHPIYCYFSTDAHLFYRPLLKLLRLHILLQNPLSSDFETAKSQVFEALRSGRFYNSIHAAGHGQGFRFWAEKGGEISDMGSTVLLDSPVTLHIQAPFAFSKEIHFIHNGKMLFRSTEESASFEATQPGFYRVEVYLKERTPLAKDIPWILSNPIFIRKDEK